MNEEERVKDGAFTERGREGEGRGINLNRDDLLDVTEQLDGDRLRDQAALHQRGHEVLSNGYACVSTCVGT